MTTDLLVSVDILYWTFGRNITKPLESPKTLCPSISLNKSLQSKIDINESNSFINNL